MMRLCLALVLCVCISGFSPANGHAAEKTVPRTIIALYDNRGEDLSTSLIHLLVEMPLNHLGLNVEYYDIHADLPSLENRPDVRGVVTWFFSNTQIKNPDAYVKWAADAIDSGRKFIVIGPIGISLNSPAAVATANKLANKIGIQILPGWVEKPMNITYEYHTPELFPDPQSFYWLRPPYQVTHALGSSTVVHLSARNDKKKSENSDLIITSPTGGYIASEHAFRENIRSGDGVKQWLINPFTFFRLAYATDDLPKPDTTTAAGRRIYYSHIDGDGWNNVTRLEEYKKEKVPVLSSQVIMDKLIKPFPDMPVTLTIISADINPNQAATKSSREIAKEFFALPQVEAGSHTYSHPFYWHFFEHYTPEKEIQYLKLYSTPTWKPGPAASPLPQSMAGGLPNGYTTPRAYAFEPFDLHKEIGEALKEIAELLPQNKKMEIITWPGDCLPWAEAVRLSRAAGVQNINGGDSRFDPEYPTPASLAPVGRQVGKERQIYASMSNENTYTNEWSENFFAQGFLKKTIYNSGTPLRLKPINVYYHIYSGEREASLNAVLSNIEYSRQQDIVPVTTSHYTHIAEGFYTTQFMILAPDMWRVENRGSLNTIRFDHRSLKSVDFTRSRGVVGERYQQGSLYVYLDADVPHPVIALKNNTAYFAPPEETIPYLIESRWLISGVTRGRNQLDFTAQGFGQGEMAWHMPVPGRYLISTEDEKEEATTAEDGQLKVTLRQSAMQSPLHITIRKI